ncbi:FtsL-like putative cell division protein [Flavobacteriales bacterium]|nr:FtsL-like putative cell division protein [Flavobacteriales bacterium]
MTRRSSRSSSNKRKGNRPLSAGERLARNIAQENRTEQPKTTRRKAGHAKPLEPAGSRPAQRAKKPSRIRQRIAQAIAPVRQSLVGEWLGGPEVTRHLPFFAFIVALILSYTYLEYQYEYDERAIKEGRKELRDLRHHEQSLRGRFESQLQRSRLDEDMANVGLTAPSAPPTTLPANSTSP